MVYCMNCGKCMEDEDKFCSNCGTPVDKENFIRYKDRENKFYGQIYKCPNCGEMLDAFDVNCPSCGYEIRGIQVIDSLKEFTKRLEQSSDDSEKASVIRIFPIPNTKEDIWEFMILASSNSYENIDGKISLAWQTKLEQVIQKARLVFTNVSELENIEKQYQSILRKIEKKRKEEATKKMSKTILELVPVLPRLIIIYSWLVSIFLLLPQCCINLDSAGTNDFQLFLFFDFIAGAIFIPMVLRCSEPLPKVVAALGIALSIFVLIPLCGENLNVIGTNAFQFLLIIEIICVLIIIIRATRYEKKRMRSNVSANGMTFAVSVVCMAVLLGIYGIQTMRLKSKVDADDSGGIYTYEIRNYIGKNVASIGEIKNNRLVDEYGSGKVRIVFMTKDGMLISSDDNEIKKQYVVVDQNLEPGTNITVVHQRDDSGEPYSNLVDYQSYEEILLYVATIGDSTYSPDYTLIQPTLDRHSLWIRDYVGRNAASFGRYSNENRIDKYGEAEIKLSFTSENGEYIDTTDINILKKYIIVSQDIAPNTELKLEYETDSWGNEYDSLIRSQNHEEISFVVKRVDGSVIEKMPELVEKNISSEESTYVDMTLHYKVLSGGKAEITGFSGDGNHTTIRKKIDGYEVVRIGDSAFKDCTTLESILFMADIESIGDYAFAGCTALKSISIPNETLSIGAHAFEGCTDLASLIIWGSASIGDYAFAACKNIKSVSISLDTERIGTHAFDGCLNLESVIIWDDDTIIEKDAFANCPKLTDRPIQE